MRKYNKTIVNLTPKELSVKGVQYIPLISQRITSKANREIVIPVPTTGLTKYTNVGINRIVRNHLSK